VDVRRSGAALLTCVLLTLGLLLPQPASAQVPPGAAPFAGTGTWVSVFAGDAVWDHPWLHVRRMHERGVDTLYLQTASSTTPVSSDLYRPARLAGFLHAAHARGMKVVAWYLPPLRRVAREHDRAMAAVGFRTSRGHTFDGFALDIEPSATTPGGDLRDDNLRRLSRRIRQSAGPDYPLGAIIPSPRGMQIAKRFWPDFPYRVVGRFYDAVLPMSYSTYRVSGAAATYDYTATNIALLRAELGDLPIHLIGGEAGALSARETSAFVAAGYDGGVAGAGLWHYGRTGPEDWAALQQLTTPVAFHDHERLAASS
jgi:hypothetical protein